MVAAMSVGLFLRAHTVTWMACSSTDRST